MENSTPARKPSKALILSVAALVLFGGGAFAAESAFRAPTVAAGEAIAPTEEKSALGEQASTPIDITDETQPVKSDGGSLALPGLSLTEDLVVEGGSETDEPVLAPTPTKKVSIANALPSKTYGVASGSTVTPVAKSYSEASAPTADAPVADAPEEEAPSTVETPVEETPVAEENPVEEVPSEEVPSGEVSDGGPVAPEPELNEPPRGGEVSDGGPVEEAPVVEETHSDEEAPVVEETPSDEEVPAEETPSEEVPSGEVSDGGPVAPAPTKEEAPNSGGAVDEEASYLMIEFTSNTSPEVFDAWNGDFGQIENFEGNPSSSTSIQRVDADTSLIRWSAGNYVSEVYVSSNDMSNAHGMMTDFHNRILAEMQN